MARIMPPQGYYVRVRVTVDGHVFPVLIREIIHCTGTKSGNEYLRENHPSYQFTYLLWTCVPTTQELNNDFVRFDTEEQARQFAGM